jgi:hypothetical protein
MSRSTPNSFQDDINRLVHVFLNRIEQLKMRLIYGVQIIKGMNGKELEFRTSDGKLYYDGIDITTGGAGGCWTKSSVNIFGFDYDTYTPISTYASADVIEGSDSSGLVLNAYDYGTTAGGTIILSPGTVSCINLFGDTDVNSNMFIASSYKLGFPAALENYYDYNCNIHRDGDILNIVGYDGVLLDSGTGYIDADNNKIVNVGTPTASGDAANKFYIDGLIAGLSFMSELADDTTPELSGDINFANYDAYYCNILYFYDHTGNNVLGTGASGQIMVVSGANGSMLGYGSGGTVYAVVQVSSSGVEIGNDVDMNQHKIYLYDTGTDSTSVYFWADTVNNKVIWHVPTGWAFDTTVG